LSDVVTQLISSGGGGSGSDTSDATAEAQHIVEGKTAYANGIKLTGTNPYEKTITDAAVSSQTDLLVEAAMLLAQKAAPTATYTIHIGTASPTSNIGKDGDIYVVRSDVT
jgi:hypothetical protein